MSLACIFCTYFVYMLYVHTDIAINLGIEIYNREFRLAGCTSKMVLAELSTSCVKIEIYKGEKYSCYIWMNRWTEKGLYHGMDVLCELRWWCIILQKTKAVKLC